MKEIGESTSSQERRAIQLERDVNDMKKADTWKVKSESISMARLVVSSIRDYLFN